MLSESATTSSEWESITNLANNLVVGQTPYLTSRALLNSMKRLSKADSPLNAAVGVINQLVALATAPINVGNADASVPRTRVALHHYVQDWINGDRGNSIAGTSAMDMQITRVTSDGS